MIQVATFNAFIVASATALILHIGEQKLLKNFGGNFSIVGLCCLQVLIFEQIMRNC